MNTSLIKANEAFFASSACAEENNGSPPRVHTSTPGMSRMSGDRKEKESKKKTKKKTIWFHASLTRSLTDCDLPLLHKGKEVARPRCHKTAQSGC